MLVRPPRAKEEIVVSSLPRRILIVANRTASTPMLLDDVRRRARSGPHHFTLLVPDPADRKTADWTLESALPLLERSAGGPVEGITGGREPFEAVRETVQQGSFDEIIISCRREPRAGCGGTFRAAFSRWGYWSRSITAEKNFIPSYLPEGIGGPGGGIQ